MEGKNRKNKLSEQRTQLAMQRTVLANARTFSAWIRTGLSSVLAGLAIVKFIGNNEMFQGYVLIIGVLFVLIGIATYILAYMSYKKSFDLIELKREESLGISLDFLLIITGGMILTAILIMGLLIFYR